MDFFFLGLEERLGSDNKFVKLNKLIDFNKFRNLLIEKRKLKKLFKGLK